MEEEEEENFLAPLEDRPVISAGMGRFARALSSSSADLSATRARANVALSIADGVNPDQVARGNRLFPGQSITNIVARQLNPQEQERRSQIDGAVRSPTITRAFQDPYRAGLMRDDTEVLGELDDYFGPFRPLPRERGGRLAPAGPYGAAIAAAEFVARPLAQGFRRGRVESTTTVNDFDIALQSGLANRPLTRLERAQLELSRTTRQALNLRRDDLSAAPWTVETIGAQFGQLSYSIQQAPLFVAAGATIGGGIGAAAALIAGQVGPQVAAPEEILTVPAGALLGARVGGGAGFNLALFYDAFRQETGAAFSEYTDMRLSDGTRLDNQTALGAALATGIVNGAIEALADRLIVGEAIPGLNRLTSGQGQEVVDRLLQTDAGRSILRNIAERSAKATAVGGFTEFLQETVSILVGQTTLASAEGLDPLTALGVGTGEAFRQTGLARSGAAALEGAIGSGGVVATTSAITAPIEAIITDQQIRQQRAWAATSQGRIETIEAAIEVAGRTRLVERDRGELARFINEATEESPVSTIYVSLADIAALATAQNSDVDTIAARMGATPEALAAAQASGFDVEIATGDFIAAVTNTDLAKPAVNIIKTNPLLYSRNQIAQLETIGQEEAVAIAERMAQMAGDSVQDIADVAAVEAELNAQIEPIKAQLEERISQTISASAPGLTSYSAQIPYARIAALHYGVIAKVLGVTPQEAFRQYPLRVAGMDMGGMGQPMQEGAPVEGGPIVRAVTREIPVLPEFGTPEWTAMVQAAKDKQARGEALTANERALINMGQEEAAELARILDRIRNGQELTSASQRFLTERGYDPATGQRVEALGQPEALGQRRRAQYRPDIAQIELGPNSDLSSFLHELGHHWLEVNGTIALDLLARQRAGETLTPAQEQYVADQRLVLEEAIKRAGITPSEGLPAGVVFQAQQEGYLGQDPIEAEEWLRAKAKGLDMSLEARMERARAMKYRFDADGEPTDYWHGTNAGRRISPFDPNPPKNLEEVDKRLAAKAVPFEAFRTDRPAYFSRNKTSAEIFGAVRQYLIREGKVYRPAPAEVSIIIDDPSPYRLYEKRDLFDRIKSEGYDIIENTATIYLDGKPQKWEETIVLNPATVRSIHAAFDPDFADSPNLLAQTETLAQTRLTMRTPEEAKKFVDEAVVSLGDGNYYFRTSDGVVQVKLSAIEEPRSKSVAIEYWFTDDNGFRSDLPLSESIRIIRRIHAIVKAHAASHGPRSYNFFGISESRDRLNEAMLTRDPPEGYKLSRRKDLFGHFILVRQSDAPAPTKTDIGLVADAVLNMADYNAAIDNQERQDAFNVAVTSGMPLYQEGDDEAAPAAPEINPVAQRIRNAYLKLRKRAGEYVWLSDIRQELADLPRDQVDEQIKQLFKDNIVNLTLSEDQGALTAEQKNASLRLGLSDMHLLSMDYFASKPFPTAAPPQPPPPPPPIGPAASEGPRPGQDPLEWFASLPFEQRRPIHEAFAQMTEIYFTTGKAPTPRLKDLFERFKQFMIEAYKSIEGALAALGRPLSDEVRQAMDRLIVAQINVQRAEEGLGFTPAFATKPAFMSQQEWEGYQELTAQATREANGDLSTRLMRDMQWLSGAKSRELRKMQRQHAAERTAIRDEVTEEVADKPVNRARRFIARGIGPDGQVIPGPHKLSKAALQAQFPEVDLRALGFGQYGLVAEQGLDPDTLASMLGYQNGEALLNDLLTAPKQADEIKSETDRRMLERYGEMTTRAAMESAANEAVHSQLRGRALQAQHAALAKAIGSRSLLRENAQAAAKIIVGRQPASKLNPRQAMAAERLASRRLMTAMKKGDLASAATASRDQLLAFEITAETFRAQKAYQDALRLFRRVNTGKKENVAKSRNYDLVQAARAILSVYGAGTKLDDPQAYIEAVEAYDPKLFSSLKPTIDRAIAQQKPLKDLSVNEVEGLRDVIDQLYTLSREEMKLQIAGQQIELQSAVDSLTQRLQDIGAPPPIPPSRAATEGEKRARQLQGLGNWLRRVESWARAVDGGVGPFTRLIWRPVSQAADAYRNARNDYIERFRNLFTSIEASLRTGRQIEAPELGYTFIGGKAELLHAILHTGNESNKRKLLLGMGWGTLMPDGATVDDSRWRSFMDRMHREGVITQADYDFAQSVWDLLEEIKPLAQKAHRAVFGRYFSEITAQTVSTPFGDYRGGYVPAIYDPMRSQDAALKQQQEGVIEANDSQMFPTPASGFTKSRVDYSAPMLLDLKLLTTHIDKVLMFSYLAAPVRGVLRILKQKEFSNALNAYDPTAQSDMLLPWLQRSARQIVETPTTGQGGKMIDGTFRYIRRNSGMGLMMANLVNVLQQVTGFSLAAVMVKPHRLASALVRYTLNPMGTTDAVRAASPMMRERGDNQAAALFGEVTAIIDPNDRIKQLQGWFARHAYFMQVGLQNVMDVIVWQGAYSQAIAEGETHAEAVARGDSAVRLTQTSSLPEDVSRVEAGNVGLRIFTHMYNYFNMWGNTLSTEYQIAVRDMGLRKGAGRLVFLYIAGFAVPALIGQLIADAMRGQLPEDDEDDGYLDEWLQYFFGVQAKTALAFAPIVGQVGVATMNVFNEKPYDDRIGGAPAISIVESAIRTPNSVYKAVMEEGDKSRAAKDLLNTMTIFTGVPFTVLSRPVGYAIDVAEGDVEPTDELDYARGLVTGSASEASKQ